MVGKGSVVNNFIYLKFIKNCLKASSFEHFNFIIKILIEIEIVTTYFIN